MARRWEWVVALVLAAVAMRLFSDYGMGWDAPVHAVYGEAMLDYLLGQRTAAQTHFANLYYYGYLFDLPSAALHRLLGVEMHAFRGVLSAWCAIACLPAVAAIGRRIGGERAAMLGCLMLVLMPQFFGQAFINQKDIPLAAAVCWAVVAILRLVEEPSVRWGRVVVAAAAMGAVLAMRVGALFIGVFLLAAIAGRLLQTRGKWLAVSPERGRWRRLGAQAAAGLAIIWVVVIAGWPYAHEDPWRHPLKAIKVALDFPSVYPVLYAGHTYPSNALPRSYLPAYLALNLQPVLLVAVVAGGLFAAWQLRRIWREPAGLALGLVFAWVVLPVGMVLVARPPLYDGMRHLLFLLPALALLAAVGLAAGHRWLEARAGRWAAGPAVLVFTAIAAWPLVRWHPYQYAYTNFLAGPPAERHRQFEGDYWKTSYKAAAEWLNAQQRQRERRLRVVVAASDFSYQCLAYFLDPRIKVEMTMADMKDRRLPYTHDFYVGTTRFGLDENFGQNPVVWEERRDGVLLCVIRGDAPR